MNEEKTVLDIWWDLQEMTKEDAEKYRATLSKEMQIELANIDKNGPPKLAPMKNTISIDMSSIGRSTIIFNW